MLTAFTVIGFISLIWCFIALWASLSLQMPRTSLFPEIDFVSNIYLNENIYRSSPSGSRPVATSLQTGRASDSATIRKHLAFTRFGVRIMKEGENAEIEVEKNNLS